MHQKAQNTTIVPIRTLRFVVNTVFQVKTDFYTYWW